MFQTNNAPPSELSQKVSDERRGGSVTRPKIFVVLGMPRTGTTFLYHTLQSHPSVFLPYRKEGYYFSVNFYKGEQWFNGLYAGMRDDNIGCDIGPIYFLDPRAIDRILEYDKDVKVILGVRDPVSFAVSLYNQMVSLGWKIPPMVDMMKEYEWKLSPKASLHIQLGQQYISKRIEELRSRFGRNLMLYQFNSMREDPLRVLKSIEEFVGIPSHFTIENFENVVINASGRRNMRALNFLLKDQRILSAIYAILPKSTTRYLRNRFDRLSVTKKKQQTVEPTVSESRALEELFTEDAKYVNDLFVHDSIVLGSGDYSTKNF